MKTLSTLTCLMLFFPGIAQADYDYSVSCSVNAAKRAEATKQKIYNDVRKLKGIKPDPQDFSGAFLMEDAMNFAIAELDKEPGTASISFDATGSQGKFTYNRLAFSSDDYSKLATAIVDSSTMTNIVAKYKTGTLQRSDVNRLVTTAQNLAKKLKINKQSVPVDENVALKFKGKDDDFINNFWGEGASKRIILAALTDQGSVIVGSPGNKSLMFDRLPMNCPAKFASVPQSQAAIVPSTTPTAAAVQQPSTDDNALK